MAALPLLLLVGCSTVDPGRVSTDLKGRLIDQETTRQQVAVRFVPRATGEAVDYAGSGIRGNARDERRRYGAERTTIPDAAADRWLEGLVARLAKAWPAGNPPLIPKVQLVADKGYGAAALSNGSIRLHLGTLLMARTEDEVAFVLAHEMAHLFLRHEGVREDERDDAENLRQVTSGVGAVAASLSASQVTRSGSIVSGREANDRAALVGLGSLVLSEGLDTLVEPAWARRQEAEADVFALDLMVAAGFDPRYALTSLESLGSSREAAQARIKGLVDQVQTRLGSDLGRGDLNAGLRTAMQGAASVLGSVGKEVRGWLRERHPEPAERRRWLDDYRDRLHGDAALRPDRPGELDRLRNAPAIRNTVLALNEIEASQNALARNEARAAIGHAQAAISAAPWLLAARLHLALARLEAQEVRQARDELRGIVANPKAPMIAFIVLAGAEARLGETGRALAVLETAGQRFDAARELAPERIALHRTSGNMAMAESEAQQCARDRDPALRAKCREALGPETRTRSAAVALPFLNR